jgi:hypothetical protein
MAPTIETRHVLYQQSEFDGWVAAHAQWWPKRLDPSVWGRFASQAACGRYTFSHVNQPHWHFAETLVASGLERDGYVCWTSAKVLRKPQRAVKGFRGVNTRLVDALLESSVGIVPQCVYESEYGSGLRVKNVDVVGFNCRKNHWVFAEAKRDHDPLHPEQEEGLRFLRRLLPPERAEVYVALVRQE